jgi:hypothetical protein
MPAPAVIPLAPLGEPADASRGWRGLALDVWTTDGTACQGATFEFGTSELRTPVAACRADRGLGWSPDGRHHAGIAGNEAVEITDADGTIVATMPGGWSRITRAGWSPAGGWIWVDGCVDRTAAQPTPVPSGPSAAPGFGSTPADGTCAEAAFIVRSDGSAVRAIPGHPLWPAHDERLVVQAPDGTIQVSSGDGSLFQAIGSCPMPAAWSPDADRLAYLQDGDAWVVAADGSGARNVTRFALPVATAVSWSPAADLLAVTQNALTWLVPLDGGEPRRSSVGVDAWAPDGSAFIGSCQNASYPDGGLCVVSTTDLRPVMLDRADILFPVWSPDSRFILVSTNEGPDSRLVVFRADGSGGTTLPLGRLPASDAPQWLP